MEAVVALLNDDGMSNYVVATLRIVTAAFIKVDPVRLPMEPRRPADAAHAVPCSCQTHPDEFEPFMEGGQTAARFCQEEVEVRHRLPCSAASGGSRVLRAFSSKLSPCSLLPWTRAICKCAP